MSKIALEFIISISFFIDDMEEEGIGCKKILFFSRLHDWIYRGSTAAYRCREVSGENSQSSSVSNVPNINEL